MWLLRDINMVVAMQEYYVLTIVCSQCITPTPGLLHIPENKTVQTLAANSAQVNNGGHSYMHSDLVRGT